jgi:hypothetical protein
MSISGNTREKPATKFGAMSESPLYFPKQTTAKILDTDDPLQM